jgi:hypothetical protein
MINPRWVTAHGERILIETLETPSTQARNAKKSKQQEEFVMVPLQWAAAAAKDTNTRGAMVWIFLLYMAWKTKSPTFPLSNVALVKYGISRYIKLRILAELEAAGRITVQRQNGRATVVTLVGFSQKPG